MIMPNAYSNSEFNLSQVRSSVNFELINKEWKYSNHLKNEKESVLNQFRVDTLD
jgi:hypothetical protein